MVQGSVMFSGSRLDDSPSVTLEKGAYRMRAPRARISTPSCRGSTARISHHYTTREKRTAVLIFLLVAATISCFGTAYYLFKTRSVSNTLEPPSVPYSDDTIAQVIECDHDDELRVFSPTAEDRYLAYLPHSGFHNQRIAFENALVLSRLLNRTLLVPPIRLGEKPIRYVQYDILRQFLAVSGKEGLHHCLKAPPHSFVPDECIDYFNYTYLPWEWLVDLAKVKMDQTLLQVWNFTESWSVDHLGISQEDTLTLRDTHPYQYRFSDYMTDASLSNGKFFENIYIPDLAKSPARHIQIGTLFGSSRLRLKEKESLRVRKKIRKSMAFSNSLLLDAADGIKDTLGGIYLGAHIRVGDSHFKTNASSNARMIWWRLVREVLRFSTDDTLKLENKTRQANLDPDPNLRPPHLSLPSGRKPHPPLPPLPKIYTPHIACRGTLHTSSRLRPLNIPLFISTDSQDPTSDPSFALFLRTFPCTFFLSDFPSQAALLHLRNNYDGVQMHKFLIPFLDAMVVGKAREVVGTEGSTYSRFVQDVLWRTYNGWEIVQRG